MRPRMRSTQTVVLRRLLPSLLVLSIALAATVYGRLSGAIIEAFDRKLTAVSALTGALIDPADHAALTEIARRPGIDPAAEERQPAYVRNVEPMRRIRRLLDLTYVYTQVLGSGDGAIFYVLDGTEGEDHSAIGETDTLPEGTFAGLQAVSRSGGVYISPVELQERWGMLKTGAAPIRAPDARVVATAGVDVNISIIQVATETALFRSAALGVTTMAGALLASWLIATRLARPIVRLQTVALKAAAGGEVDSTPKTRGAREIGALARSLDRIVRQMGVIRQTRQAADEQAWGQAVVAHLDAGTAAADGTLRVDHGARRLVAFPPAGLDAPHAAVWRRGLGELVRSAADDGLLVRALALQPGTAVLLTRDALHVAGDQAVTIEGPDGTRRRAQPGETLAVAAAGPTRIVTDDGRAAESTA